jgi:hypothetical protein
MTFTEKFCTHLKWTIYEWIGSISQRELLSNRELARQIETLCKRLNKIEA